MASGETSSAKPSVMKIVLVGDFGVGKSSILLRLVEGKIPTNGPPQTIGVDYKNHILSVDGQSVELNIWDTAGQERYKSITQGYYKGTSAVMIIYDPTDLESFNSVPNWLKDVNSYAPDSTIPMLIENKCDLRKSSAKMLSPNAGEALAAQNQILFKETSAFDGTNVQAAFEDLVRAVRKSSKPDDGQSKGTVQVRSVAKKKKKIC